MQTCYHKCLQYRRSGGPARGTCAGDKTVQLLLRRTVTSFPKTCWSNSSRSKVLRDASSAEIHRCERMVRMLFFEIPAAALRGNRPGTGSGDADRSDLFAADVSPTKTTTGKNGLLNERSGRYSRRESEAMIERLLAAPDAREPAGDLVAHHASIGWDEIVKILTERVLAGSAHGHSARPIEWRRRPCSTSRKPRATKVAQGKRLSRQSEHAVHAGPARGRGRMHEQAAALFEKAGEQAELARTLSGSIQPMLLLGRYEEALAAGERARADLSEARQYAGGWRGLEINIGNIYHRQDRFAEALGHYQRAYERSAGAGRRRSVGGGSEQSFSLLHQPE